MKNIIILLCLCMCVLVSCKSKEQVLKDEFKQSVKRDIAIHSDKYKICKYDFLVNSSAWNNDPIQYKYAEALQKEGYAELKEAYSQWSNDKGYYIKLLPKFSQDFDIKTIGPGTFGGTRTIVCFGKLEIFSLQGYQQRSDSMYIVQFKSSLGNKAKWLANDDIKNNILRGYSQLPEFFIAQYTMIKSDKGWDSDGFYIMDEQGRRFDEIYMQQ